MKLLNALSLKVNVSAGVHIGEAYKQVIELRRRLGIQAVSFDFNGVECSVSVGGMNTRGDEIYTPEGKK